MCRMPPERRQLRADISLDDEVYKCKRSSAAQLFSSNSPSTSSSDSFSAEAEAPSGTSSGGNFTSSSDGDREEGSSVAARAKDGNGVCHGDNVLDDRIHRADEAQADSSEDVGEPSGSRKEESYSEDDAHTHDGAAAGLCPLHCRWVILHQAFVLRAQKTVCATFEAQLKPCCRLCNSAIFWDELRCRCKDGCHLVGCFS
jgi:hypothetical protein